jgi:hypothetical protein
MPRWLVNLCLGASAVVAFACNDELSEEVTKDVCYSERRWIGGKRGSPEMYPGRDCVGCHIDNDGPPLAIGGTLYPYILPPPDVFELQSGEDCFGIEGIVVTIEDGEGQLFPVTTNRAGNFYVEGNPDDFAKPFRVVLEDYTTDEAGNLTGRSPMATAPMYGGCARCHDPNVPSAPEAGLEFLTTPTDAEYRNGTARIGLPGYSPDGAGGLTVVDELRALVGSP